MRFCTVPALFVCAVAWAHAASYTSYIGDQYQYQTSAITTDSAGNTYVTGSRILQEIPQHVGGSIGYTEVVDVFVSKVDSSGNSTLLGTFGSNALAFAIAVDASGNIYVTGASTSTFPLQHPLQSTSYPQGTGFLIKLAANGSVIYSTYLGGALGASSLSAVAADAQGNAYVTGWTQASDYPHTPGLPAGPVSNTADALIGAAFFAKINPAGSQIVYAGGLSGGDECGATCQGITVSNVGTAIAVDPAGNAYIAGNAGAGLPTTTGSLLGQGLGPFVAKVAAAANTMDFVTYLIAGNYFASISAIAVDSAGDAYLSGATSDPTFPVTAGAFQTKLAATPSSEAFVAKLNPAGSAMVWATFLGASAGNSAQTIAVMPSGAVWVSGTTQSADYPTTASVTPGGGEFLTELNSTGSSLVYSALFPTETVAQGLAVDANAAVHAAGSFGLVSEFPASAPPGQSSALWTFGLINAAGGTLSGRLAPGELIAIYGLNIGPTTPAYATAPDGFLPTTLAGVRIAINGVAAPLLYASATQINVVTPVELIAGSDTQLQLTVNGAAFNVQARVDGAAPGVFINPNSGGAAAINQDGALNSPGNPAPDGSFVSIWTTGTGYFPGGDGQFATVANQFCTSELSMCSVLTNSGFLNVGNIPQTVLYSGAAPDLVNGVVQVNFQVSASAQNGYFLSVGGFNSIVFTVYTEASEAVAVPAGVSQ